MSKARKLAKAKPAPQPSTDASPKVPQRPKLDWNLSIRERNDLRDKQKVIRDLILDKTTKVVFINGCAGTAKTYLAVYSGLLLLQQKRMSHICYVRTIAESASKSLGSLPGEIEAKVSPYLMPLTDKLEEMLPPSEVKRLVAEKRAIGLPINYARGASMNATYIVVDEAQNYTLGELTTILTRLGEYSKVVIVGDDSQSDIGTHSAFLPLFDWFNQSSFVEQGIHCVSMTKDDIVRSGILRVIVEALEGYRAAQVKTPH